MSKKNLVIVESPAKAKTIGKFLGPDYEIKASFGHVRDLPDKKLGVDLKKNFEPTYIPMKDKAKILKELQSIAKKSNMIYLATDPDREGEAIAWHIQESIQAAANKVRRIVFNEITQNAVQSAVQNSREIDMHLVDAQQARRILDRLIGYKLSPILSKKIRRGLSAGRVQSVAVKIICDREKEILAFVPQEYWVIEALLDQGPKARFVSKLFAKDTEKTKYEPKTQTEAEAVVKDLKTSQYSVAGIKKTQIQRNPQPPFITSSLQQEASRKLNWTAKRTMIVAQQLYEGVDIGPESVGLITYMRTDSTRIAQEAQDAAKDLIRYQFGDRYLATVPRKITKKSNVQDAHEAIRPTYADKTPSQLKDVLNIEHYKLYKLIWERFIASQMCPSQLESTVITVKAQHSGQPTYFLKTTGSIIVFDGFTKLYSEGQDTPMEDEESLLPQLNEKDPLNLQKLHHAQKFTQPPPRYTEATLVKELEEKGIGRPSTYAPTLSVIQDRGYINKDKKNLLPSDLGMLVNEKLEGYFNQIIDVHFTAQMETQLDDIMEGKNEWQDVIAQFYAPFTALLDKANLEMEKVDNTRPSDEICTLCNSPMIIRAGRFGDFLACSNFPACKNTKSMAKSLNAFCPTCKSELREKRTRKGKIFYGCGSYPNCTFASWDTPIAQDCPTCSHNTLFVKKWKGKETTYCAKCTPPASK